jgi:adenylate cyclase
MRFTAAQRQFARLFRWAVPVCVVLGAVFGHFTAPDNGGRGYVQGAVGGILISTAILLLEFFIFSRARGALARRVPFLVYFALRSLGYLAAILLGLSVSAWLLRAPAGTEPLIERTGVTFSLVVSLGFNLLYGVNDLLGPGVLFNFIAGRYRRPRSEERVLLFIDMASSTAIAERLGETRFLDFLNRFVADVTAAIVAQRGAIQNMSATRSSSPGRWPRVCATGVACAPVSTRWRGSTTAPTRMFATSVSAPISAPPYIAARW